MNKSMRIVTLASVVKNQYFYIRCYLLLNKIFLCILGSNLGKNINNKYNKVNHTVIGKFEFVNRVRHIYSA